MKTNREVTSDMEISLCMIVKDEEEVLARCLESVKGCVEEMIIVDTGSVDNTLNIARQYTDWIYDFAWHDDFAAARNVSFSKATKEYILWLDADDFIDGEQRSKMEALKQMLQDDRPDVVFCPYDVGFDENHNVLTSFRRERIVRRCAQAVWRGRVHECIAPFGKCVEFPFRVTHLSSSKPRGRRNLHIYQKWAAEEKLSPRDTFYYGRELYYHKLYSEAVAVLTEMINGDGWYVNQIEACKIRAFCLAQLGKRTDAYRSMLESFRFGEPRASVLCELGHMFCRDKKYREALFWYESAERCRDHSGEGDFEEPLCRTLAPLLGQVKCLYCLGEYERALAVHMQTLKQFPDHPSVRYNSEFFNRSA